MSDRLINSLNDLSKKYFIIESVKEQGEAAAEQWLNCEDKPRNYLKEIIAKYENSTMFEQGIEGVNERNLKHQEVEFLSTEAKINKLRRKSIYFLLFL